MGDQPAQDDALGFEPYVKAMADFLTNPLTIPPLTISIEGDWGTGKSSFMTQLEQLLLERGSLTIRFNAWRHDKHEELWAAFALELIRQISARQRFWRRWMANLELRCKRFDLAEGWLDFARATAIWFCMIVAAISLPILLVFKGSDWLRWLSGVISDGSIIGQLTTWSVALGGAGALAVAFASLFLKLRSVLGNPVAIDLRKYLRSPKYEDRVAFIEDFHRDLERIVRSYAGTRKVVVFVDDLDRCEVPKAAELMQAINLMIANDPQLIFVVGMDREKIAAGIAVKQEKLIPFVTNSLDERDATSLEAALYYGYRFIEKFIQVPFTVPVATVDDVQRFFQRLNSCSPEAGAEVKWWRGITQRFFANKRVPLEARVGSVGAPRVREDTQQRQQRLKLITGNAETEAVQQIVLMAAELLEKNPRRIKQFINLFRLRAHIANETGLFDVMTGAEPPETVTLEQLGKFVAITQMHPRLLVDLENDSRLLSKLQRIAEGDTLPPGARKSLEFWANNPKLIAFLRFGVIDGPTEDPDRFTLAKLDVNKLLAISPRVHRPSSTEA